MPPLSDHDRAALAHIEVHLAIDDPDLALLLATSRHRPIRVYRSWRPVALVAGLALLVLLAALIALLH